MEFKICKDCSVSKAVCEYRPKRLVCKSCLQKERKKNYDTKEREQRRAWRNTWHGKALTLAHSMKYRSENKGWEPCEWSYDDILHSITNGRCCKTLIPFSLEAGSTDSFVNPFAPSPDRIDSSKGYTKGNVQWTCYLYNAMKKDFTEEQLNVFIKALKSQY